MTSSGATPVEHFKPTTGVLSGYVALAVVAFLLVDAVVTDFSVKNLSVILGLVVTGIVVGATLLRPRAVAYADRLVLMHGFSDTVIPMSLISSVAVRQTMHVYCNDRRYICAGIGESRRQLSRQGSRPVMGLADSDFVGGKSSAGGMTYSEFVVERIMELAKKARAVDETDSDVRREWAWPLVVPLAVSVAALLLSLLL